VHFGDKLFHTCSDPNSNDKIVVNHYAFEVLFGLEHKSINRGLRKMSGGDDPRSDDRIIINHHTSKVLFALERDT